MDTRRSSHHQLSILCFLTWVRSIMMSVHRKLLIQRCPKIKCCYFCCTTVCMGGEAWWGTRNVENESDQYMNKIKMAGELITMLLRDKGSYLRQSLLLVEKSELLFFWVGGGVEGLSWNFSHWKFGLLSLRKASCNSHATQL